MESRKYNKLVRDKIPEVTIQNDELCTYEFLSKEDYDNCLDTKLKEEMLEYQEDKSIEELADMYEVLLSIVKNKGYTLEEFEKIRKQKAEKHGGFDNKLFLREVKSTVSLHEFIKMVNVQYETLLDYENQGKIVPDYPASQETNNIAYYKVSSVKRYVEQFGWTLITDENIYQLFKEFVIKMDMYYSYKPVFLKALFNYMDNQGEVNITDVVDYFMEYYKQRRLLGKRAERSDSIFQKGNYNIKSVQRLILANPYKRFSDMSFMNKSINSKKIILNQTIFKKITNDDIDIMIRICDNKLDEYYKKI